MSGRQFTPEFKRECAELVLDHGYTVSEACKATDVGSTAIRRWVKQLRSERNGGITAPSIMISPSISPTATSHDADPQSHDLLTIAITINGLVGYASVLEQTEHHGYHIHAVFYLNGQKHRQVWTVFETLRDIWKYVIWEEGHTHRYEPKEHYRVRGEWVTAYEDIKGRKNMQYILSYLSKQEQKTLGVICQLSDIPAPPGAGRRRKAS